jgi:hypothetical protein
MVLLIILVPLLYLIPPLWLTAALLLLVALSILYFTWEPLLQARWAIWLAAITLLVVDSEQPSWGQGRMPSLRSTTPSCW